MNDKAYDGYNDFVFNHAVNRPIVAFVIRKMIVFYFHVEERVSNDTCKYRYHEKRP